MLTNNLEDGREAPSKASTIIFPDDTKVITDKTDELLNIIKHDLLLLLYLQMILKLYLMKLKSS